MNESLDISVCVPAYNRPVSTDRLVRSFLRQTNVSAELVITDDSTDGEVERLVSRYRDERIRYLRNPATLGYCFNLRSALLAADGRLLLTLGDDDFLVDRRALACYVDVFKNHPEVVFAYANRLQVSLCGAPDVAFHFFKYDRLFDGGVESWTRMWQMAGCIAGICIRNDREFLSSMYPKTSILYPQSLLVGALLGKGPSFGISQFLIGVSAHEGLLGYSVDRGQNIFGEERHGTVEYLDMVDDVVVSEKERGVVRAAIGRQLALSLAITLPNEALYGGRRVAIKNAAGLIARSWSARRSVSLWLAVVAVALSPPVTLRWIKDMVKCGLRIRDRHIWRWYMIQCDDMSVDTERG